MKKLIKLFLKHIFGNNDFNNGEDIINKKINIRTVVEYNVGDVDFDNYKIYINNMLREYYKMGLIDERPKFYKK